MDNTTYTPNYLRFVLWYVGLSIGLPLALNLLARFTGVNLSSSALSIIPMMIASMQEGVHFARTEGAKPAGARAWRVSVQLTAVALVLTALMFAATWFLYPALMEYAMQSLGAAGLLAFLAVYAVLGVLLARLFLGLGARNEMKVLARKRGATLE